MYKMFASNIDTSLQDKKAFQFKQRLFEHPALTLENITRAIPEIDKGLVYFSGRKMEKGEDFERAINEGRKAQPIEEVIAGLATSNSYIMIREPESHRSFRALHNELVEDIGQTIRARGHGSTPYDPRSYIFISSPNSITPFHYDRASNFLFQIKGSKAVTVFPPWDSRVITSVEYESHMDVVGGAAVKWKPESEVLGTTFRCLPGDGLHIPFVSGHHVKNGPDVSVTLSIFFNDRRTLAQLNALRFNHRVRTKLGVSPVAVGRFQSVDAMKSLAFRGYARLTR